jgi:hypothetical protein
MTEYAIRKNVPMPGAMRSTSGKYNWDAMKVGDSFVVPKNDKPNPKSLSHCATNYSKKHQRGEWKFSVRSLPDGDVGVWRTE